MSHSESVSYTHLGGENEKIVPLTKNGANPQIIVYLPNKKVCIYLSDERPTADVYKRQAFVKEYSENEGMGEFLTRNGIACRSHVIPDIQNRCV